jgi:hypothetical protein
MSFHHEHLVPRRTVVAVLAVVVTALPACDKLESVLKKDGDAAAPAASSRAAGSGERPSGILSFFGSDFEGEITMTMTVKGKAPSTGPDQIVYGMKKPKYRVDTTSRKPGEMDSVLFDLPTKKGYVLMHSQKLAIMLDFEKMKSMRTKRGLPDGPSDKAAPSKPPQIEKTGKNDVVAGYSCEIWNVTSEGKKTELCVAAGITWLDVSDLGLTSPQFAVAAVATEANCFPLRIIAYDANNTEEVRLEATKVDKKKLDAARFVVPADYRVMEMSALVGGFMGIPSGIPTFKLPPR